MLALASTDERVRQGKPTSPGFLFATLLWHEVLSDWEKRKQQGSIPIPALLEAMDAVLDQQSEKLAITRRIGGDIKDIWALQPRFEKRSGKMALRLLEQPRFRAGYDFLLLRAESGEVAMELAEWWTRFQEVDIDERMAMLQPDSAAKKRRRGGRGRGAKAQEGAQEGAKTGDLFGAEPAE
jgi:poly(A) polymerase